MARRLTRPSVRALAFSAAGFFGVLVVAIVLGLTWTSRQVRRAMEARERHGQLVLLKADLEDTLREHHRLSDLLVTTDNARIEELRSTAETDAHHTLREIEALLEDTEGRRLLSRFSEDFAAYRTAVDDAEARGLPLDEAKRAVTPAFERVLASSDVLGEHVRAIRARSAREVARAVRRQNLVAMGSTAFFVISLMLVTLLVTGLVLRPTLDLHEAVRRFREGDRDARASGGGSRETDELAISFNQMVDALAHQRQAQLTYLAGVAHDLRNPLGVLKMGVQVLERAPAEMAPEQLRRLERQVDRLARMVGDLLDATRIEAGQLELRLEEVELGALAGSVVDLFTPTTDIHELTLHAPESPVVVRGDPLRIEQVISNLIGNAIKYSPDGGPVDVTVEATAREAQLSVSDRGMGIPPEEIPDLFLPFRRRPRRGEPTPGAGLGLSIVRRIVKAHGGRVDVESAPGVGSTFRVWLPLAGPDDGGAGRPPRERSTDRETG